MNLISTVSRSEFPTLRAAAPAGSPRGTRRAFTLVELLVVIGIIAVLVGVLLPALGKARGRAQTIACMANMRSITQAIVQYTVEYKGVYPFGFAFNRMNPANGRPADGGASGYITWFSSADKYMTRGAADAFLLDANSGFIDGATRRRFNPAFRCPSVGAEFKQQVHYYQHGVVMPHLTLEMGLTPAGRTKLTSPAKVGQVFPNTALLWDTPLFSDAADVTPAMFWGSDHTISGYAAFCTMIDDNEPAMSTENALLAHPEYPERRHRSPQGGDRVAGSANPMKGADGPIALHADDYLRQIGFNFSANTDFGGGTVWNPGNARFRHNGLGCNVAYVDGSVRTFFLNNKKLVPGQSNKFVWTDWKRGDLMTKWPGGGIKDSGLYPAN